MRTYLYQEERMKIILVDDEYLILDELEYCCSQIEGVEVCGAFEEAQEALAYIQEHEVDFAFLDIQMPGMTGLELLKQMKVYRENLQAAFVTAYTQYALEAFQNDACDYLIKPFGMEEIRHALDKARKLCGGREEGQPVVEMRTFGRFDVMKNGHAVVFKNRKAKELLALLVSRRGGVVESDYAIEMLWEDEPFGENVRVKYRKALMNLKNTLKENGISEILAGQRGSLCLDCQKVSCDYFRLMNGEKKAADEFQGEFLFEYSWGEEYIAELERKAEEIRERK